MQMMIEKMRLNKSADMRKCLATKTIALLGIFLYSLLTQKGLAQTGEHAVDALVDMGFANVG